MPTPLIIAHRGASALTPENTLASFERAIDEGADGIEFDVRLAADGVPVVIHDATLQRVAGLRKSVQSLTSTELAKIDVGSWFNRRHPNRAKTEYSSEGVPTLERTLEFLRDFRGLIYVELKCRGDKDAGQLVDAVAKIIAPSPLLPQIIVQSFNLHSLPKMRQEVSSVRISALFAPKMIRPLKKKKPLVDLASQANAGYLSLHHLLVNPRSARKAAKAGFPITVWTVDRRRWVRRAQQMGIFALITNNPIALITERAKI